MQQFYDTKEVIRVVSDEYGNKTEQKIESLDRDVRVMRGGKIEYPIIKKDDINGLYDFVIATNSTLATSKELRRKQLLEAHDRAVVSGQGIIDFQEWWRNFLNEMDLEPQKFLVKDKQAIAGQQPQPNPQEALAQQLGGMLGGATQGGQNIGGSNAAGQVAQMTAPNSSAPLTDAQAAGQVLAQPFQ